MAKPSELKRKAVATPATVPRKSKKAEDAPIKRQRSEVAVRKAKPTKAHTAVRKETHEQQETHSHKVSPAAPGSAPRGLRIVAGSYERFLYGIEGFVHRGADGNYTVSLTPRFVFPAHVSSIRCVACAGRDSKWLATGGMDETIKVWDLRRRKEVGALTGHEGTITSLSFPTRTFLLSASEDGTMNLYRTRDWALLRTMRGHKGRINSASAHPSGRVALSVGADRMIRMWDLRRGMGSASVKIGAEAEKIVWDTQGKRFAVLTGRQVLVYGTNMSQLARIEHPKRLHDVSFTQSNHKHEWMLVPTEAGVVHIYDVDDIQGSEDEATPREVARLVGHSNRVRSACATHIQADDQTQHVLFTTISSDGLIRVFRVDGSRLEHEASAHYDTKKSRLTCLSSVGFDPDATEFDEDEEEEDDEDEEEVDEEEEDYDDDIDNEELARLEEEVRRAREAGIIIEGLDDDEEEEEEEEEEEQEED